MGALMSCPEFRPDLSPLADNALEGQRAVLVWRHLHCCSACRSDFDQIQAMRTLLAEAGRVAPPQNLALAIRSRISREAASSWTGRLRFRFQNLLEPLALPALAGFCSALLMFGVLIHTFALPAITDDIPLNSLATPPRVIRMPDFGRIDTGDEGITIQVNVNQQGLITDFLFLTPVSDPETMAKLREALVLMRFDPATSFGMPRPGTTVLSYRTISIKG